jgi:glycosyltransferase involved in cell wall biosynthesis
MKIGLVLPALPAYSETFFRNKIQGLVQSGYEVFVFVNHLSTQNNYFGAQVISTCPPKKNSIFYFWDVLSKLLYLTFFRYATLVRFYTLSQKEGYTFLSCVKLLIINRNLLRYSLDWLHFGFGTMAIDRELVPKAIGAKMAVSFRGFDIAIYPLSRPNCYTKLWNYVDKIHVISDDLKAKVIRSGGEELLPKCVKITPAIDITLFERKEPFPVFQPPYQFTTVARLHWKKGLEYTLKALSLLKKKGVLFHYTIIGSGIEEERLRFVAQALGLEEEVTFAGKLCQEEIKAQLEKTHVYIQYSIQEGFCNAVLEAQAIAVFCVVSDAEGLSENIVDGVTGIIVPKRKAKDLASDIDLFLNRADKDKINYSLRGIERVKQVFEIKKQQALFVNFYND